MNRPKKPWNSSIFYKSIINDNYQPYDINWRTVKIFSNHYEHSNNTWKHFANWVDIAYEKEQITVDIDTTLAQIGTTYGIKTKKLQKKLDNNQTLKPFYLIQKKKKNGKIGYLGGHLNQPVFTSKIKSATTFDSEKEALICLQTIVKIRNINLARYIKTYNHTNFKTETATNFLLGATIEKVEFGTKEKTIQVLSEPSFQTVEKSEETLEGIVFLERL